MAIDHSLNHRCHAEGCGIHVEPSRFACKKHWFALPKRLQVAIWREYRTGQEVDKKPSLAYMAVQQCAVAWLAKKEGRDFAEAALKAVLYEAKCREAGTEPLRGLPRVWENPE